MMTKCLILLRFNLKKCGVCVMKPSELQQSVWGNTLQYRVWPDQEERQSSSNENLGDSKHFKQILQ